MKIGIVGSGKFGLVLARIALENENKVLIYSRRADEIESLNKTHLKGLNIEEKRVLLRHILDNLKIPILKKEAAVIKKKILEAEDDEKQSAQVNKYNEILKEIKIIQNKELE